MSLPAGPRSSDAITGRQRRLHGDAGAALRISLTDVGQWCARCAVAAHLTRH